MARQFLPTPGAPSGIRLDTLKPLLRCTPDGVGDKRCSRRCDGSMDETEQHDIDCYLNVGARQPPSCIPYSDYPLRSEPSRQHVLWRLAVRLHRHANATRARTRLVLPIYPPPAHLACPPAWRITFSPPPTLRARYPKATPYRLYDVPCLHLSLPTSQHLSNERTTTWPPGANLPPHANIRFSTPRQTAKTRHLIPQEADARDTATTAPVPLPYLDTCHFF